MKLKELSIVNFKGIQRASFDLNCQSAVFFGINGAGKTSILRAINLLYSNMINQFVNRRFKQGINIDLSDISNGESVCSVTAEFLFEDGDKFSYSRSMERKNSQRTHNKKYLALLDEKFKNTYLSEDHYETKDMPIFVNYGVHRLVLDIPLRIKTNHTFDKESSFQNAIESKIDFRTFFEWFRMREDYENEMKVRSDLAYEDLPLKSVKIAIESMFDHVKNLRIQRNPLSMKLDKNGQSLTVNQLSDGEKCTLAMIGDLARRLTLANISREDPLAGDGVVLIDEIELHMHPGWQRRILPTLRSTFPNIQFIVSTHSPQVLGELDDSFNIYSLKKTNDNLECEKIESLIGWDTNYILEDFMETTCLNKSTQALIKQIYEMVAKQDYDNAETLVDQLALLTDYAQEDVVKAQILISRGKKKK